MSHKLFTYSFTVKKEHLDIFSHMNNSEYLKLFEEARWDLITKNGYGIEKIQATQLAPTILKIHLSFLKELRLDDHIIIETHLLFYKNKIGKLAQNMMRNNEVCCEAEFTIGLFDLKTRKLVLPTTDWLYAVGVES